MTVYTALLSNYEALKEPQIYTPDWNYVCFTDQPFESKVWQIIPVPTTINPRKEARRIKALFNLFISDPYSMWIDGSFIINCDLNEFWQKHFQSPFSAAFHPTRKCVYDEIRTVISSRRGGADRIKEQGEHYRQEGLPEKTGLISSGILLRQNTIECRQLCREWWTETDKWSLRDQVSFAKVSQGKEFHTFNFDYRTSRELIYIQHNHRSNKFASNKVA